MTAIRTTAKWLFYVALGVVLMGTPFVLAAAINALRF